MEKKRSALLFFWILFLVILLAGGVYLIVEGIKNQAELAQHLEKAAAFLFGHC